MKIDNTVKTYTIPNIPAKDYKKLRLIAAKNETSINKTLLRAIKLIIKKEG